MKKLALTIFLLAALGAGARCASVEYVSLADDISQFYMYADGGWDGNWYVGYNNCWIVRLPAVHTGKYKKAYIGARLGRAKTISLPDRPWEKKPIDGKIFMGLSPVPAFNTQETYFLADLKDLPREAGPKDTIEGVSGAQWYWAEVPLSAVSANRPNYLAIWSASEALDSAETSPIIAGASSDAQDAVWLYTSGRGTPPKTRNTAPDTQINSLSPALVLKLVPEADTRVQINDFRAENSGKNVVFSFSAAGSDIYAGWLEMSFDRFNWQRASGFLFQPPYTISFEKAKLPQSDVYFRAAAQDGFGQTASSGELLIRRK